VVATLWVLALPAQAQKRIGNPCARLGGMMRYEYDCCGANAGSGICIGLAEASKALQCSDQCSPAAFICSYPPPSYCSICEVDASDPNVSGMNIDEPFVCGEPEAPDGIMCCVYGGELPSYTGATCQSNLGGATFDDTCYPASR
jgi:hypothetical protein